MMDEQVRARLHCGIAITKGQSNMSARAARLRMVTGQCVRARAHVPFIRASPRDVPERAHFH